MLTSAVHSSIIKATVNKETDYAPVSPQKDGDKSVKSSSSPSSGSILETESSKYLQW
jgi:hypothetical protein